MGMRKNQGQFSAPQDDNFDAFGGQIAERSFWFSASCDAPLSELIFSQ
jgi:hypothetical protein